MGTKLLLVDVQKDYIHNEHKVHRAVHSAPALEYVVCIFTAAHSKSERCHKCENTGYDISLANIKEQLY